MGQAVVLIHGLIRTKKSMSYLGSSLTRDGYQVFNFGYKSTKYSIKSQAERLHGFLQENLKRKRKVNFVTHSLGSIIVRKFALEFHKDYKLGRVVMLGPPNQGSRFAAILNAKTPLGRVLGPAFKELCDLNLDPATEFLEVGIIAGGTGKKRGIFPFIMEDSDGVVAVRETKLKGAKDTLAVKWVHSFLMYHPGVIKQIKYFFRHGKFERSGE